MTDKEEFGVYDESPEIMDETSGESYVEESKVPKKNKGRKRRKPRRVAKKIEEQKDSISLDKLLIVILALSLLFNFYMFYQSGILNSELNSLRLQISYNQAGGQQITGNQASTPQGGTIPREVNPTERTPSGGIASGVSFTLTVLNDKRCRECDTSRVISQLKSMFPGMTVKNIDHSSSEGKKMYEQTGVKYLPAILFPDEVKNSENYAKISQYLQPAGDYRNLQIGSKFDPTAEICDNDMDDTGNGKSDCEDESCSGLPVCLDFDQPTLTYFIMSYCPYGNQAEEGIEPVYQLLKDKAKFEPKYIYYENYQGGGPNYCMDDENKYCAMHGIQEAHQNIREQCVMENYGMDAWFEFALAMNKKCSSSNADTCWTDVAKSLGYDTESIKTCEEEDYAKYASEDLKMSKSWGASGSPTIFVNGKPYRGGRTPEAYKQALCDEFDDKPSECETQLEGATASGTPAPSAARAPSAGGACGG